MYIWIYHALTTRARDQQVGCTKGACPSLLSLDAVNSSYRLSTESALMRRYSWLEVRQLKHAASGSRSRSGRHLVSTDQYTSVFCEPQVSRGFYQVLTTVVQIAIIDLCSFLHLLLFR